MTLHVDAEVRNLRTIPADAQVHVSLQTLEGEKVATFTSAMENISPAPAEARQHRISITPEDAYIWDETTQNGINPDAKRHPDDFYVTEPRAVIELMEALESLKIGLPPIVVDSSVGSGIIADAVQLYGHDVIGYDVEDRGWAY